MSSVRDKLVIFWNKVRMVSFIVELYFLGFLTIYDFDVY